MKDLEKLKQEQAELKEKLTKLVKFINSEEFFKVKETEKALLKQQRAGMEVYLTALTNRIYNSDKVSDNSTLLLSLTMCKAMQVLNW